MKQTIRVGDNLSRKLHDEVSADLKGYVEVQVKNKHTGEIEHQENHNLIVYGGREWLLRRIFGSSIANNDFAMHSGIKWVGFGCGGGEAGNPLQAGTTLGHDNDLYQPCRIRFRDDSNNSESNGYYASRILPNGSIVSGYFKKISNVTIKEDHANPYIENNIRKYPRIIAEVRVELSSDDCNGENYTENGNLVAYQDINEVGLFISDLDAVDPGQGNYDEKIIEVSDGDISQDDVYTSKTFMAPNVTQEFTKTNNTTWTLNVNAGISPNSYILQYQQDNGDWFTVKKSLNNKVYPQQLETGDSLTITKSNTGYSVKVGQYDQIENWSADDDLNNTTGSIKFRLLSVGMYFIRYKCAIDFQPEGFTGVTDGSHNSYYNGEVLCELQYRNYTNENWKTIDTRTLYPGEVTDNIEVLCNTADNPDISAITNFRVRQTINSYQEITLLGCEPDETSNEAKYFVSYSDIQKIKVNNYIFTENTESSNYIPETAPLGVIEVVDNPSGGGWPYFVIEKADAQYVPCPSADSSFVGSSKNGITKAGIWQPTVVSGLRAFTYAPSAKSPYTMFSRVCLSSIRKTIDREICIIWKIYC